MGMDGAMIRFYNEAPDEDTTSQLLYKNIIFSTISCIIVGIPVVFFAGYYFSDKIFGIVSKLVTGMVFVYSSCQIILRYLNISYRMSFQITNYNIQNIMIASASRIFVILAALFTSGFLFIVSLLTIGMFLTLLIYLFVQRNEITPRSKNGKKDYSISFKGYKHYFRFALFSAPTYIVINLNLYLSQQIIVGLMSSYALGIFASTGAFSHILNAMKGGFSTYWSAYVYKYYKTEQDKIIKMHDYVMFVTILAVSLLVVFRDVLYLAIGENFHESKSFFSLLLVMPVMNIVLETTEKGIFLRNRNEIAFISYLFFVIINIGLSFILIKSFGLKGAAAANAVSGVVLFMISSYYGQKHYKSISNIFKTMAGLCILLGILWIPSLTMEMTFIAVSTIVLDFIAVLLYNKECLKMGGIIKSMIHTR